VHVCVCVICSDGGKQRVNNQSSARVTSSQANPQDVDRAVIVAQVIIIIIIIEDVRKQQVRD